MLTAIQMMTLSNHWPKISLSLAALCSLSFACSGSSDDAGSGDSGPLDGVEKTSALRLPFEGTEGHAVEVAAFDPNHAGVLVEASGDSVYWSPELGSWYASA